MDFVNVGRDFILFLLVPTYWYVCSLADVTRIGSITTGEYPCLGRMSVEFGIVVRIATFIHIAVGLQRHLVLTLLILVKVGLFV